MQASTFKPRIVREGRATIEHIIDGEERVQWPEGALAAAARAIVTRARLQINVPTASRVKSSG
jgi:hypothetical protein